MTAAEAREKLEAWRDILKAKLEFVTKRPWIHLSGRSGVHGSVRGGPRIEGDKSSLVCKLDLTNWEDGEFFVLSSVAVPAMLAGIEAALSAKVKDQADLPLSEERSVVIYTRAGKTLRTAITVAEASHLIALAEAYEPYFQEVSND